MITILIILYTHYHTLHYVQKIALSLVCNGDIDRPIRIEVLDHGGKDKHVYMGQVRVV